MPVGVASTELNGDEPFVTIMEEKGGLREEKNPSLDLLDDFAGCEAV